MRDVHPVKNVFIEFSIIFWRRNIFFKKVDLKTLEGKPYEEEHHGV